MRRSGTGARSVFGAIGKNTKDYYGTGGTIPRGKLPDILKRMEGLSREARAPIASMRATGTSIRSSWSVRPKSGDLEKAEASGEDIPIGLTADRRGLGAGRPPMMILPPAGQAGY